ncbi:hypothetical protein [Clostridium sp. CCUG 7971]|uniref:hypothetical protein n=1 Tax=Clostridium sp. CCUG 7971 TaxID=2811414 RepID=UPI001ABB0200|nr:hypothetical protein [Clostridium sp. CCUG 7971]MBO3443420.1 hypothetical protein [Clostridium sp. CCUG 7971]
MSGIWEDYITADRNQYINKNKLNATSEYVREGGFKLPIDTYTSDGYQTVFWIAFD